MRIEKLAKKYYYNSKLSALTLAGILDLLCSLSAGTGKEDERRLQWCQHFLAWK